jgi:hypothetical protein
LHKKATAKLSIRDSIVESKTNEKNKFEQIVNTNAFIDDCLLAM